MFLGTVADNNRDMVSKGRSYVFNEDDLRKAVRNRKPLRGEEHASAKIETDTVRRIRSMAKTAETKRSIATALGVS